MKKLKEQRGVTILMALLLVLTAAVVSAVILAAALSATRRVNSDRSAQQNYLTVSSAAELLRESIKATTVKKTVTIIGTREEQYDEEGNFTGWSEWTYDFPSIKWTDAPAGLMNQWLLTGVQSGRGSYTDTITIELKNGPLAPVKAEFGMNRKEDLPDGSTSQTGSDCDIMVKLSLSDAAGAADCRMTLTMQGKYDYTYFDTGNSGSIRTIEKRTVITWESPEITKGLKETEGA